MKFWRLPSVTIFLLLTTTAKGDLLHVDALAIMPGGSIYNYFPTGTVVNASVYFDLETGPPYPEPSILSASGTFTWNDLIFNVSSAQITSESYLGGVGFKFFGIGPSTADTAVTDFFIGFDIGVNPFTTLENLSDLLVNSSIDLLGAGVWNGNLNGSGTTFYDYSHSISGSVNVVPIPASIWLFASGLIGLVGIARNKTRFKY